MVASPLGSPGGSPDVSAAVGEAVYGDRTVDQGDEVRFSVELTRIDRLDDTYSLDVRRLKGNLRSYKFLYDTLREYVVFLALALMTLRLIQFYPGDASSLDRFYVFIFMPMLLRAVHPPYLDALFSLIFLMSPRCLAGACPSKCPIHSIPYVLQRSSRMRWYFH